MSFDVIDRTGSGAQTKRFPYSLPPLNISTQQVMLLGSDGYNTGYFAAGTLSAQNANAVALTGTLSVGVIVVTTGATYVVGSTETIIVVNKTTGSATAVTLPSAVTNANRVLTIVDGKGDAATNNITVSGAQNINASASVVINTAYGVLRLVSNGTTWNEI